MKNIKRLALGVLLSSVLVVSSGCMRQSSKVSYNVSKEADNFNVVRRLTVMSAITNEPVFELIGAFSFEVGTNRLDAVVETSKGQYKKHTVGFGENVVWVVEDLYGSEVGKYKYEVHFAPESIVPITGTMND